MVSSRLKEWFQGKAAHISKPLAQIGVTPNTLTLAGLLVAAASATAFSQGEDYTALAGLLALLSGLLDALDGVLARVSGKATRWGGFLDSVADRASDGLLYSGVLVGGLCDPVVCLVALLASQLVSYSRARAEAEGVPMAGVGLAERGERILLLGASGIAAHWWPPTLCLAVAATGLLSVFTVLQRTWFFKKNVGEVNAS